MAPAAPDPGRRPTMANMHCRKRSHDLVLDLNIHLDYHYLHTDSPTHTPTAPKTPPATTTTTTTTTSTTTFHRQRLQHGLAPRRLTTPIPPVHHSPYTRPAKRRSRTLSHAPSMPVHIASVMSAPYPYPSFMSVYGSDESQLEESPDCVCYEQQVKEQDLHSETVPSSLPHSQHTHTLPLAINARGSINSFASDSTTASSSATTSHSSPSFSDPSPTSSPESACSTQCLSQFKGTMAPPPPPPPSAKPKEQVLLPERVVVPPHQTDLATQPVLPSSPGPANRNVKKLSLNMPSITLPRPGSLGSLDPPQPFSAPVSPLKEPLRSARRRPNNLTIRTPGFQPQLSLMRDSAEVPPTPSSTRPSMHSLVSSPSLPWLTTPTTCSPGGLHVSLPSFGSGYSQPCSDYSMSNQSVTGLPELREEYEAQKSQETQENGYPDGPVCIYDCGVYLYLEPTAAEARQFDTVINVAKEIKNPFDKAGSEDRTVVSTLRDREVAYRSRDAISEPQTAISEMSFKTAQWERHKPLIETALCRASREPERAEQRQPEYVHVPWDHNSEILHDLPPLCRLIDDRTRRGKKVLIHCQLGVSRSASLTIAYGLWVGYQPDFHSMYMQVKKRSPWVGPNMGLIYQLTDFRARVQRGEYPHAGPSSSEQAAPDWWFKNKDPSADECTKTPTASSTAKAPAATRSVQLDKELPPVPLFSQKAKDSSTTTNNKTTKTTTTKTTTNTPNTKPRPLPHVATQMSPPSSKVAAAPAPAAVKQAPPPPPPAATKPRPLPFRSLNEYANVGSIPPHKPRRAPPQNVAVVVDQTQYASTTQMDLASRDVPLTPSLFSPRSAEFVAAPIGISHNVGDIVMAGSPTEFKPSGKPGHQKPSREDGLPSRVVDPRSPHQLADTREILGSIDGVL